MLKDRQLLAGSGKIRVICWRRPWSMVELARGRPNPSLIAFLGVGFNFGHYIITAGIAHPTRELRITLWKYVVFCRVGCAHSYPMKNLWPKLKPTPHSGLVLISATQSLFENSLFGSQSLQRFRRRAFKSPFCKGGFRGISTSQIKSPLTPLCKGGDESLMLSYGYVNFGLLNLETLTSLKGVFKQALRFES